MDENVLKLLRLIILGGKEWAYFLVGYLMTIMATYLTGVWELSITHASQIMNLYSGTLVIMPVVMNLTLPWMRSLAFTQYVSKIAFFLGLVMLTISASGTCKEDESLCIGTTKRILFFSGLFILAVAVSAHETWTEKYRNRLEMLKIEEMSYYVLLAYIVFPYGALIAIGYISPWWIKFLLPTIYATAFCFSIHKFSCDDNEDVGEDDGSKLESRVMFLTEAIYVCICSVLVSVIFTVGNTFFILQAVDLNPKFWFMTIAVVSLPVIKESVKGGISFCSCDKYPFGLFWSIIFATLCCITAAKVETRRLNVVVSEGVVDDPTTIIPMTMCWLIPQYALLGLAEKSFDDHLQHGLEKVVNKTFIISKFIRAAGFYGGVLSVYAVGELKPTWIQDTINTSQLDNYYWFLAVVSAVNLLLFLSVTFVLGLCIDNEDRSMYFDSSSSSE